MASTRGLTLENQMESNVAPTIPRVIHSFSSLNYFNQCAFRYQQVKLLKRFKDAPFKQAIDGTNIHEAFERHIRDGTPLPEWALKYTDTMEVIAEIRGSKHAELKMAINTNGAPCDYWDKMAAIRGSADLVVLDGDHAMVADWKTGKVKDNPEQLELMALLVFKRFPQVQTISGVLVFVEHRQTVTQRYTASQEVDMWVKWVGKMSREHKAKMNNDFPMNPSGLCRGWCPVSDCIHYEPPKGKQ